LNPIFAAALEIQQFCRARNWRFCVIGALAVQRWGEPRLTQDVDITLVTGFGAEPQYVEQLLQEFRGRIPEAGEFALAKRVLLLQSSGGIPIDVALGALPFEERVVARASPYAIQTSVTLLTCGAEDLVVLKVFAGREKDWLDVEGVVLRQSDSLDRALIRRELKPLLELKGDDTALTRLEGLWEREATR
jgi:hypothetical protein